MERRGRVGKKERGEQFHPFRLWWWHLKFEPCHGLLGRGCHSVAGAEWKKRMVSSSPTEVAGLEDEGVDVLCLVGKEALSRAFGYHHLPGRLLWG